MFVAGTAYTGALGEFFFTSQNANFTSRFTSFELPIVFAAMWAFVLFGRRTTMRERGNAVLRGAACVFLALATWAAVSIAIGVVKGDIVADNSGAPAPITTSLAVLLLLPVVGSLVLCLTPEFVGALAGYVIWRLLSTRAGE